MDPTQLDAVSAILGALAASGVDGVKEGVKDLAHDAVGGARDRLMSLLRNRFQEDNLASAKLTVYADDPSAANAELLRPHIIDWRLDRDDDVVTAAREVLAHAGPTAIGSGSVAATVIQAHSSGSGHSHVGGVQNYGPPPQTDPS